MTLRIFGMSVVVSTAALVAAFLYGGSTAVVLTLVLGVLEVSLSFDNAVINATVLQRMSDFWQKMFLTVGVIVAVFGMRLAFPLAIVWITAGLNPVDALDLALNPPTDGSRTYESIVTAAHPQIASFGSMFLLMLFLSFLFEDKERTWLSWIERPLLRIGRLREAPVVLSLVLLVLTTVYIAPDRESSTVMVAGVLGVITYIVVNGLGELFHIDESEIGGDGPTGLVKAAGRAGFFLFLYLEVLDASFSFDGVIGAFAITADPIIIALGLGLIGAMFVRSLTICLVRRGTLAEYVYLEHGAHWAIGALAVLLLYSLGTEVPEIVTGLVGLVLILASLATSIVHRRRNHVEDVDI